MYTVLRHVDTGRIKQAMSEDSNDMSVDDKDTSADDNDTSADSNDMLVDDSDMKAASKMLAFFNSCEDGMRGECLTCDYESMLIVNSVMAYALNDIAEEIRTAAGPYVKETDAIKKANYLPERDGMLHAARIVERHAIKKQESEFCHCGEPVRYGFDGTPYNHRGMCAHCDDLRCDVDPRNCGRST